MKGIGIDLIEINRFKKVKKNDFEKWSRVFTETEWGYAFKGAKPRRAAESSRNKPTEHLAGMFAAKEAAMKAKGQAGLTHFKEWEISHKKTGAPELICKKRKIKSLLSISHDGEFAIAVVVIL